jgi:hypothetical protein
MSFAFNGAGELIPHPNTWGDETHASTDDLGRSYIYRAEEFGDYLEQKFGEPTVNLSGKISVADMAKISGNGIIVYGGNGNDGYRYVDLTSAGSKMLYGNYDTSITQNVSRVDSIRFWKVSD